ncbi:MAG: calcium/sodium antiporter [Pseudomonadota bacterium]
MLLAAATILVGFIILIWSADLFVAGAASIAENAGMSPIIIGLTIVSLGTSAPEILVSITAALAGSGEIAIGNAIGSNIANIGLVLGVTILIAPLSVHPSCMRQELPTLLLVTLGVGLLLLDFTLAAFDGWLMVIVLFIIVARMIKGQTKDPTLLEEASEEPLQQLKPMRAWLTFLLGLALLIGSSRMLVWGASEVATALGVSELVIGLTVLAIGTSLPELAATVASALRGHTEIAVGNVIGSNLFNLLAVLAIPGIVRQENLDPMVLNRDYAAMTLATLLLAFFIYTGRYRSKSPAQGHAYIGRAAGILLVLFYGLYYYGLYLTT